MKKYILLVALSLFSVQLLCAQSSYNVVFDLTGRDSVSQKSVIRWLNEITQANADAKLEVVMYGHGLDLVLKDKSMMADDVMRLAQNKNVTFKVCAIAMKNQHIQPDQLLPNVQTVPDGIYEIISKQREGWGYIKVAP